MNTTTPTRKRRRRRKHRKLRRSDIAWLAVGLVVPIMVMVGLFAALRPSTDADSPPPAAARERMQSPVAPTRPVSAPARQSGPLCPRQSGDISPLLEAAACGDIVRLTELASGGTKIQVTDPRPAFLGRSALHHAASRGDLDAIRLLLDQGASPNDADAQGDTPLHMLTVGDKVVQDVAIARALLAVGADVSARNRQGLTPLGALEADARRARVSNELASMLRDTSRHQEIIGRASDFLKRDAELPGGLNALELGSADVVADGTMKGVAVAAPAQQRSAPAPEPATEPAQSPPGAEQKSEVRKTIRQWARAWSSRDADAYLSHYAPDYSGQDGASRAEWEQLRRQRLATPKSIDVTVIDLSIEVEADRATASFTQSYEAPGYADRGPKVLTLKRFGEHWKIIDEHTPDPR